MLKFSDCGFGFLILFFATVCCLITECPSHLLWLCQLVRQYAVSSFTVPVVNIVVQKTWILDQTVKRPPTITRSLNSLRCVPTWSLPLPDDGCSLLDLLVYSAPRQHHNALCSGAEYMPRAQIDRLKRKAVVKWQHAAAPITHIWQWPADHTSTIPSVCLTSLLIAYSV